MKKNNFRIIVLLHLLLMMYSASGIFSKLASGESFLSLRFCLFYGISILILFVYAVGWQQIIKRMPLTTAFANKAVTTVWGSVWGILFFGESITWKKAAAVLLIMAGVVLFSTDDTGESGEAHHGE